MAEEDRISGERTSSDEGSEDYKPGGYHAVKIGDVFNDGVYVVQKKLGWGHYSTVWLAWDTRKLRHVALKFQKGSETYVKAAMTEIAILEQLAIGDPDGTKCVVKLLDYFKHSGPNGEHVCMVFEYLGDDLLKLIRYSNEGIPLHMVKQICLHILVGLDYLHHTHSIIHTDLKPENILLLSRIDPSKDPTKAGDPLKIAPDSIPLEEIKDPYDGKTDKQKDALALASMANEAFKNSEEDSKMGKQEESCSSLVGDESHKTTKGDDRRGSPSAKQKLLAELDVKCKLADLGNACWTHKQIRKTIQTRAFRCPEVIIGSEYSTPADLWSFACICFELATGYALFDLNNIEEDDRDENHLTQMMELLGTMPRKIALGGRHSEKLFDVSGRLRGIDEFNFWSLDKVLEMDYELSEQDANDMAGFLVPILSFDPEKRPSAAQLLCHPWLTVNATPRPHEPSTSTSEDTKGKRASTAEEDNKGKRQKGTM